MTHPELWDDHLSTLKKFLGELCITLSHEQLNRLSRFREDLYDVNQVMNLTRIAPEGCELRHFIDSLLFIDLIPQNSRVLDIGTGPGFPAFPLAVVRPDLDVVALDSSGKMLGFLRRHPLTNLTIHEARMEDAGLREEFDVVTGRALAPLAAQLELSSQATKIGGAVIPMRSGLEVADVEQFQGQGLGLRWERSVPRALPGTEITRLFPVYRKFEATHSRFPRKWAEIKRKPLS